MNFITNVNYTQSQTELLSDSTAGPFTHLYTRNTTLGETISWTTNIRKNFDMNLSAKSSYTIPTHTGFQTRQFQEPKQLEPELFQRGRVHRVHRVYEQWVAGCGEL